MSEDHGYMEYVMCPTPIAAGGFAEVYVAMSARTGQLIAIKRLPRGGSVGQARAMAHEIEVRRGRLPVRDGQLALGKWGSPEN